MVSSLKLNETAFWILVNTKAMLVARLLGKRADKAAIAYLMLGVRRATVPLAMMRTAVTDSMCSLN